MPLDIQGLLVCQELHLLVMGKFAWWHLMYTFKKLLNILFMSFSSNTSDHCSFPVLWLANPAFREIGIDNLTHSFSPHPLPKLKISLTFILSQLALNEFISASISQCCNYAWLLLYACFISFLDHTRTAPYKIPNSGEHIVFQALHF